MGKKISIVGAGNGACITALSYYLQGTLMRDEISEIEIYYNPDIPIEQVGQGTLPLQTGLISRLLGIYHHRETNKIGATLKSGILYENWGKKTPKNFHPFLMNDNAIHYSPHSLSKAVLESGMFTVIEKDIINPEEEIDSDFIFDCRGAKNRDKTLYRELINPLNSALIYEKEGKAPELLYTRCVATPHGWTFAVPNLDSVSYGYLYNDTITSTEEARQDFLEKFDIPSYTDTGNKLSFDNYVSKSMFTGERTILNGNKFCFLEPLEATSTSFYHLVAGKAWRWIMGLDSKKQCNHEVRREVERMQNFLMWHYHTGSKYDTPFWDYAKKLSKGTWDCDNELQSIIALSRLDSYAKFYEYDDKYAQWHVNSVKNWDEVV